MRKQSGAAVSVHSIANGQAEAVEFIVDAGTRHCGEALKGLQLHRGVLIVCISHNGKTVIPDGDSVFLPGDTVIVVTGANHVLLELNDIFE